MKYTSDADDPSLHDLSPEKLLTMLRAASSETERVGEEDVRGSSTVRYRLTVDCELADLECEGAALVEVWIDDDGLVRRIGLDDDSGTGTFEFFDFGADVDVEPPPADEVVSEDEVFASEGSSSSFGPVTCAEGEAKPISQRELVEALERNEFNIQDFDGCLVFNASGDATGTLAREGLVDCGVHAEPPAGAPRTVTHRRSDGADAEFALENIECSIETAKPGGEKQIGRLEQALDELEQTIRP